jgi:hypothetical protein
MASTTGQVLGNDDSFISALDAEAYLLQRCQLHLRQRLGVLEQEEQRLRKSLAPSHATSASSHPASLAVQAAAPFLWQRAAAVSHSSLLSDSAQEDDASEDDLLDAGRGIAPHERLLMENGRHTTAASHSGARAHASSEDADDADFQEDGDESNERLRLLAASERLRHRDHHGRQDGEDHRYHVRQQPPPVPQQHHQPPQQSPQQSQPQQQQLDLLASLGGSSSPWLAETAPAWARQARPP